MRPGVPAGRADLLGTVNGVAQSKAITRFLFVPPSGTLCQ